MTTTPGPFSKKFVIEIRFSETWSWEMLYDDEKKRDTDMAKIVKYSNDDFVEVGEGANKIMLNRSNVVFASIR